MSNIFAGRYTADIEGPFVVFIIGMRINRFFKFHRWVPVARAMGPMIKELYQNHELGFLGMEYFFHWRGVTLIQYWKSYDQLEKYARGGIHLEAWKNFNKNVGTDGTVGIFHETYLIAAGQYECIYGNMPKFGLARAKETNHVSAIGKWETSRRRLGGHSDPPTPTPQNPNLQS